MPRRNTCSSQNTLEILLQQFLAMSDQKTEILFHEKARLLEFALNWNNPNVFCFFTYLPKKQRKTHDSQQANDSIICCIEKSSSHNFFQIRIKITTFFFYKLMLKSSVSENDSLSASCH